MSKRSKVLLIVLVSLIVLTLVSITIPTPDVNKDLEEFEKEIVDPNNQLEPLSNSASSMFLIDIAKKIENVISSIVRFFVSGITGIIESIF
jgi:predicted PurR-regulated permease PerM